MNEPFKYQFQCELLKDTKPSKHFGSYMIGDVWFWLRNVRQIVGGPGLGYWLTEAVWLLRERLIAQDLTYIDPRTGLQQIKPAGEDFPNFNADGSIKFAGGRPIEN